MIHPTTRSTGTLNLPFDFSETGGTAQEDWPSYQCSSLCGSPIKQYQKEMQPFPSADCKPQNAPDATDAAKNSYLSQHDAAQSACGLNYCISNGIENLQIAQAPNRHLLEGSNLPQMQSCQSQA